MATKAPGEMERGELWWKPKQLIDGQLPVEPLSEYQRPPQLLVPRAREAERRAMERGDLRVRPTPVPTYLSDLVE